VSTSPAGPDAALVPAALTPPLHWRFFAMNTDVRIFVREWHGPEVPQAAENAFHALERRLSRFLPDSELSRLNERAGERTSVSSELFRVLEQCERFHAVTGGAFDPAVLPDLESAGYDRSFEQIESADDADAPTLMRRSPPFADVVIDCQRLAVECPPGVRLDLGGIGKGFAVDEAARILAPARDYLIDAGGDIYAAGDGWDGPGWLVGIADPLDRGPDLDLVRLRDEALATSTVVRRRWQRGGRWQHHLIDPRTGAPAASGLLSVSVIAPTTVEADVFAKVALISGLQDGRCFLAEQGAPGLFVLEDGSWQTTDDWAGGVR
jgi:thiamine biosynthesis lipoprotein